MASVDPAFGVDSFNRPKVLSETETIVNNILFVLFGKPGSYPSIPSLGMDIENYLYLFEDEIDTNSIKTELAYQCREFLPYIVEGDMDVLVTTLDGRSILIFQLPVIIATKSVELAIGVTINAKGEMVYNFTAGNKEQYI